jgi:uncharacterized Fe-S cluster-containing radical SAM superfamily protein
VTKAVFPQVVSGNDAFALGPFILEWFAGNKPANQLPISAVCNCHCLFCSNNLNPFPVVTGLFRDIADIKLQLCSMAANDDPIRLSDSLPGRISEGEALLHPGLFEILDLVRRKFFYNTLCFTTNVCLLDEAFLKKLAAFRPIEINVSLHSAKPELWARIFAKSEADARTAIHALPALKRHGIELTGTIVPLPRLCGWDDLEQTYEYLVTNGAKSMILFWPGYTVRTPGAVARDLACPLEEFTAFAQRMKARFSTPLSPHPDMVEPLPVAVETIIAKTLKGNPKARGGAYGHVVWLASRAAFDRLGKMVAEKTASAPNRHEVVPADNLTYRGNIIASGLLMVDDFISAGRAALERWPETDLFLVPSAGFDSLCRDLKGIPAYKMAESLGRPVWLVQNDGVLDAQLSFRIVNRRKPPDPELPQTMKDFNAGRGEPRNAVLISQRFESLDPTHAICLQIWQFKDGSKSFNRWTRLAKQQSDWRIESTEEGLPE